MNYSEAEQKISQLILTTKPKQVLQKTVDFLYENFDNYNWVGIYLIKGNNLILGPWRGPSATEHTNIPVGQGICGAAAKFGKTEIVSDVNADNRYLSCFVSTKSEIVIPIKKDSKVVGEIDIDSDILDAFNDDDVVFLEKVADMLCKHIC